MPFLAIYAHGSFNALPDLLEYVRLQFTEVSAQVASYDDGRHSVVEWVCNSGQQPFSC